MTTDDFEWIPIRRHRYAEGAHLLLLSGQSSSYIRIRSLRKSYQVAGTASAVLRDVDLDIEFGEFCALTGTSGSGKTTLLNLIGTLDTSDSGEVRIGQRSVSGLDDRALSNFRNQNIGFIFQSFHLLPRLTVRDNVALPLVYRGISVTQRRFAAEQALSRVGLGGQVDLLPDQLSGGQRQRVAIARALVGKPSILLADEPTGNLDSQNADLVMDLLVELNRSLRVTMIVVTHDRMIAAKASRQIVLRDGRIFEDSGRAEANSPESCHSSSCKVTSNGVASG